MTEVEWLFCEDPTVMLAWLTDNVGRGTGVRVSPPRPSDRKLRLWVEACRERCDAPHKGRPTGFRYDLDTFPEDLSACLGFWSGAVAYNRGLPLADRAALLHEVIGNPWQAVQTCARNLPCDRMCQCLLLSWRTPTALAIARQAYDERDWQALPVLADALEDAGCSCEELLRHLRARTACGKCYRDVTGLLSARHYGGCAWCGSFETVPFHHVRGCWAVDIVLGEE